MISTRRTLKLYWITSAAYGVLMLWWVYFFFHQGDRMVEGVEAKTYAMSSLQADALREEADKVLRMLVFEGSFIGLLLIGSVYFVVNALRREVANNFSQKNFLSAVTHELRSPIASARLYLDSLRLGRVDEKKSERYIKHALEDIDRLQHLVDQILQTARMSSDQAELAVETMDLSEFVQRGLQRLEREHVIKADEVKTELQSVSIKADSEALYKVLNNLVSNAVKYGGENANIEVSVRPENNRAVLEVRDHGPGLNGADPKEIFQAFKRGGNEDVRTQQGVGLGLFLVAQLVQAHSGKVFATDGLKDGGTLMRVELPSASGASNSRLGSGEEEAA